jgi:hypothetical protein
MSLIALYYVYSVRHFVVDIIWRLPVWNVKIRRYLASCMLQFSSNLTKIIFQGKHFPCIMSDWSNWSNVDATGSSYRYRYVLRPALNGGKKCDDILQLKKGELLSPTFM